MMVARLRRDPDRASATRRAAPPFDLRDRAAGATARSSRNPRARLLFGSSSSRRSRSSASSPTSRRCSRRAAQGGSAEAGLALGGFAIGGLVYSALVRWMLRDARPAADAGRRRAHRGRRASWPSGWPGRWQFGCARHAGARRSASTCCTTRSRPRSPSRPAGAGLRRGAARLLVLLRPGARRRGVRGRPARDRPPAEHGVSAVVILPSASRPP